MVNKQNVFLISSLSLIYCIYLINSEESIAASNPTQRDVVTPTGSVFNGIDVDESSMVAISIIRAGDSMLDVFLSVNPDAVVGKILIQRDEATAQPVLFYNKVPSLVGKKIVVLDPMLATGGSAKVAIKICLDKGAQIENMVFANVVASPEGIANLHSEFPDLTIVTAQVDVGLNEKVMVTIF